MSDIATIIQPTIKSEPKITGSTKKDLDKNDFESSLKKAEEIYNSNEKSSDNEIEYGGNVTTTADAKLAPQPKLNDNHNNGASKESNVEKMLSELINNKGTKNNQNQLLEINSKNQEPKTPQSLLVQKIEQIINDQNTPQNISIKSTTETSAPGLNNTKLTSPNQQITEDNKIRSKVDGKSQDGTMGNLFKNSKTDSNTEKITESKSTDGQLSQPQTANVLTNITGDGQNTPEISTIFGQVLTSSTSAITSQGTIQGQTANVLPSGNIVYDDKVINQIHDQFKINGTETQQKINIRLNPVELGELKIEMTMKEDSVKVNVVTQSHQAQEILERNMPKLKAILEDKGLTIEDIMVSQETKTLNEFQLSEQDMGQNQPKQHSSKEESNYAFSAQLTDSVQDITNQNDGISLTI